MFIGEAGGQEEEWQRRPFVGRSGVRLNTTISSFLGVYREEVYVTNVFKHHPPRNKKPSKKEITSCLPWLQAELLSVNPEIVVLVGGTALQALVPGKSVSRYHGLAWRQPDGMLAGRVVVPWFHPAAGMRNPKVIRAIADDAKRFWSVIADLDVPTPVTHNLVSGAEAALHAMQSNEVAFDVETTARRQKKMPRFGQIVGYSISTTPLKGLYVAEGLTQSSPLTPLLEDPTRIKICHNVQFEYSRLQESGITLRGFEDTRGLAYLLQEDDTTLKGLARRYLMSEPTTFDQAVGDTDTTDPVALGAKLKENYAYGAADASNTKAIYPLLLRKAKEEDVERVYRGIELPLVPVLAAVEAAGVGLDVERVVGNIELLISEVNNAENAVYSAAGREFNIRSTKQRSELLAAAGAPIRERTDSGLLKTDRRTLLGVQSWNPALVGALLRHGEYTKLQQFLQSFLDLRWEDGKLHPRYNQFGHEEAGDEEDPSGAPATGRLSCSYPNIQQIPNHRNPEWGHRIRSCLVPPDGYVWLRFDFAQEEPRVMALLSQDPQLLGDFAIGVDIYAPAATALYGYPVAKPMEERQSGKNFFLLWIYGGGADKAVGFDPSRLTVRRAEDGILALAKRYKGIVAYWERQEQFALEHGYVTTLFGRKRWIPEVFMKDRETRQAAFRKAINTPVQGTCGDVMKLMLVRVHNRLDPAAAYIAATVHDELDIMCKPWYTDTVKNILAEEAASVLPGMALPMEFSIGPSWGEAK